MAGVRAEFLRGDGDDAGPAERDPWAGLPEMPDLDDEDGEQ